LAFCPLFVPCSTTVPPRISPSFPTRRSSDLVMGWRVVPTDSSCLGPMALDCLPQIEQVFVEANAGAAEQEFAVQLFRARRKAERSEEHTSELQSRENLVCRLLLEKKKNKKHI